MSLWGPDDQDGRWTATRTEAGAIQILRRSSKPPYRDGDEARVEFAEFFMQPENAKVFAETILANVEAI